MDGEERTDQRGTMREGESREEERKVRSSKIDEEAQQSVQVKNEKKMNTGSPVFRQTEDRKL